MTDSEVDTRIEDMRILDEILKLADPYPVCFEFRDKIGDRIPRYVYTKKRVWYDPYSKELEYVHTPELLL